MASAPLLRNDVSALFPKLLMRHGRVRSIQAGARSAVGAVA